MAFENLFTEYKSYFPSNEEENIEDEDYFSSDFDLDSPISFKNISVFDTSDDTSDDTNLFDQITGVSPNPFSFNLEKPDMSSEKIKKERESNRIKNIINTARQFLGGKYVWGGKSPKTGFDCSGFISYVYKQNGIDIPASTYGLFKTGKSVQLSNARIGDIICTPGSGKSGRHVKMISKIVDGQIYTIEAKGKDYGIVETPLTKTDNIISIRRIENTGKKIADNGTFANKQDFVKQLKSTYKQVLNQHGLDPNYANILTASAVMESGWGTKVSGDFNYGGVKSTTGTSKSTIDYVNGKYIRQNQTFRNFKSVKDYCEYIVNLLSNKRYNAFNLYSSNQPLQMWRHVLDAGYGGGDSNHKDRYVQSVGRIYNTIQNIS